jgi:hypothetical protein
VLWYSGDEVSWSIYLGWHRTKVLLISASQVVRITGMRHQCLAISVFWDRIPLCSPGWSQTLNPPVLNLKIFQN